MRVLLLAGEESGVLYARQIRDEILRRHPDAEIRGYGDYGFETGDLAVFGVWAVLRRIGYFLHVKRTMEQAIDTWKPDVLCTIDYPGLNLKLAAYAKARGIRAVHVVCPQVWAWHQDRIPKIERTLDHLCCFLPFEPALFKPGFATFVGHPLVEEMEREREQGTGNREQGTGNREQGTGNGEQGTGNGERVLAVLPGSRMGEIEKHLPTLLKVIEVLQGEDPTLKVIIPAANDKAYAKISSLLPPVPRSPFPVPSSPFPPPCSPFPPPCSPFPVPCSLTHGHAREALRRASAAVVASGTATFEAAIVNCPFVVVYRVSALLAAILRKVLKGVRHVGLVNVIAEKAGVPCPMPELLQEAFTPENVLAELRPWLGDPEANAAARRRLADTMRLMRSEDGAIGRIVDTLS